ncbi:MarR family transcriptional regulator [Siphonobacter sp. BAB-5405]|uniref:MarR family winged helix-turn-helix transcriptional regulator n=1 Tax=Siphonobacter sp. BAB-5405 TaxID=1864825 RepID=UPI000C809CBF|nr:MarR family winged helix-turn-helix transcriptional regulator [Siphonobacter sp. BAB-5405]PMD92359.1 MarR family transcriptional regulator [Siphonobacter sp. BAB-5405]
MTDSIFNLEQQNSSVDAKIVAGLERVGEVFRVLLWQQSRDTGLSPIQIQVLLFLAFHEPTQCKVGYLAKEFNLTKPTISDAVKVLVQKALVDRITDPLDSRSHHLELTPAGKQMVDQTSSFANVLQGVVKSFPEEQKTVLYESLFKLIFELTQRGLIQVQRMCKTCRHYRFDGQIHYCGLLQIPLEAGLLRLDCPEHEQVL